MPRSKDLPSFDRPPINELVLGVQFARPSRYQLIYAHQVYELFREKYPVVQEQGLIAPAFETFGGPPAAGGVNFAFGNAPQHPRFWFVSKSGHELLQFQPDKFFHNWRQLDDNGIAYPRYGSIRDAFAEELRALNQLLTHGDGNPLNINQVEVSYYNRFYGPTPQVAPRPDAWLKFLDFGDRSPEGFNGSYREIIRNPDGHPIARLYIDINSAVDGLGREMIVLALTARGAPYGTDVASALEFLDFQSDYIVRTFADITTEEAHGKWQRTS